MIRIALCMETENYGKVLKESILEWMLQNQFNSEVELFFTGEELLADMEQTGYFPIVLMDIHLRGNLNGIDTASRIRRIYKYFCLIFMSQEDRYCKEMFKLHPFCCLPKPVERKWLNECLSQAVDRYQRIYEIFAFRYKGMNYCIRLSEVVYFVSDKRIIRILMEDGREYAFYGKLDEQEKVLRKYLSRFLRIHQSYLINGRQIEQYHSKFVVMRNGERLPITRREWKNSMQGYCLLH